MRMEVISEVAATCVSPKGRAFAAGTSDVQVEDEGTVSRRPAEDLNGRRRQRLIVRLASGQTVLVAHDIDM